MNTSYGRAQSHKMSWVHRCNFILIIRIEKSLGVWTPRSSEGWYKMHGKLLLLNQSGVDSTINCLKYSISFNSPLSNVRISPSETALILSVDFYSSLTMPEGINCGLETCFILIHTHVMSTITGVVSSTHYRLGFFFFRQRTWYHGIHHWYIVKKVFDCSELRTTWPETGNQDKNYGKQARTIIHKGYYISPSMGTMDTKFQRLQTHAFMVPLKLNPTGFGENTEGPDLKSTPEYL